MIYGLLASVAWGASTVAAANAARQLGTYRAILLGQGIGAVMLVLLTAIIRPSLALGGLTTLGLAGAGLLGLAGWLSYYHALARGPVAVVSAIGATYGAVTVVLSLAMLGEHVAGIGEAGIALAIIGVAMAAARAAGGRPAVAAAGAVVLTGRHRAPARAVTTRHGAPAAMAPGAGRHRRRRGLPVPGHLSGAVMLAVVSALAYGVSTFLLGGYSARAGWLSSALVEYLASLSALLVMAPFRSPAALRARGPGVSWAAAAGVGEAGALLAFAAGGQAGEVAMTAALSSLYPAIPLAAGVLIFRERLSGRQVLGVGIIVAGLVMISLA